MWGHITRESLSRQHTLSTQSSPASMLKLCYEFLVLYSCSASSKLRVSRLTAGIQWQLETRRPVGEHDVGFHPAATGRRSTGQGYDVRYCQSLYSNYVGIGRSDCVLLNFG